MGIRVVRQRVKEGETEKTKFGGKIWDNLWWQTSNSMDG